MQPTLAVATPTPGAEIILRDDEPANAQRLRLTSSGGSDGPRWWFVDGAMVAGDAGGAWWHPTPGRHEVRVVDADGHAAKVDVVVR